MKDFIVEFHWESGLVSSFHVKAETASSAIKRARIIVAKGKRGKRNPLRRVVAKEGDIPF